MLTRHAMSLSPQRLLRFWRRHLLLVRVNENWTTRTCGPCLSHGAVQRMVIPTGQRDPVCLYHGCLQRDYNSGVCWRVRLQCVGMIKACVYIATAVLTRLQTLSLAQNGAGHQFSNDTVPESERRAATGTAIPAIAHGRAAYWNNLNL